MIKETPPILLFKVETNVSVAKKLPNPHLWTFQNVALLVQVIPRLLVEGNGEVQFMKSKILSNKRPHLPHLPPSLPHQLRLPHRHQVERHKALVLKLLEKGLRRVTKSDLSLALDMAVLQRVGTNKC